ncbi:MAG: flagellar biosynthesis protein FlhA [Bdellovibrionota bacterium]|jgi:type III secretion protein V
MKELLVPGSIIAMLISLMVPLPSWVLDFLLVSNLLLALVLLMSALVVTDPLKLSSLPSMLLLATMYRLALNVSTTRMILSSGTGGAVVEAFGGIVVRGNIVVGLVVFLVITLIQFIVIAKGSERVAEVSARFTLDALPGKQMSIDADVRAGLIDFSEARKKRQDLQTESRFYGALDGAMKFIKGDAVAALVITAINIFGGFAVGVLVDGISISSAFRQYTLLSVGDGLVSQIPALLNSLAAGMIVTRVVREDGVSLSRELLTQLGQDHKVLVLASLLAACIAFVPGMPVLPFVTLALVLFVGVLLEASANQENAKRSATLVTRFQPKTPALLQIEVNTKLAREFAEAGGEDQMRVFQQVVFEKYGLIMLQPEFSIKEDQVGFNILMRGVPAASVKEEGSITETSAALLKTLLTLIAERKEEVVDDIMTRRLLDNADTFSPELVAAVVPGIVTVTQITGVLRELIKEGISIKNFDVILQALAEFGSKAGSDRVLLEEVRIALKQVITQKYSKDGELRAYLLDPLLDMECAKTERGLDAIPLESLTSLLKGLENFEDGAVLLTSRATRRLIKEFLESRNVYTVVLAHEEIARSVTIDMLGYVGALGDEEREVEHSDKALEMVM